MSVKHPIIRLMLYLQSTYILYEVQCSSCTFGLVGWARSPFDESHKDFLYHLSYQRLIKKHFDQTYIVGGKVTYHSNTLLTYGIIGWQNIHSFIILPSLRWHDLLLKYLNRNIYFKQCPNWGGWYSLHRKRHYLGRKIFRAGIFFLRVIEVEDLHCGYNATELIFQTILLGTSIVMHCIPIMCQFLEKERKNS